MSEEKYKESSAILEKLGEPQARAANFSRLAISRQMEPNLAEAEKLARQAVDQQDEDDTVKRVVLANILLDLGKTEDAAIAVGESRLDNVQKQAYADLVRDLSPKERHAVCNELNKGIFFILSLSAFHDQVPEHYQKALDLSKGNNFFLMYALAQSQLNARRFDDAIKLLHKITELQSDYVPAWTYLGYIYEAQSKPSQAIEAYSVAADKAPKEPGIAIRLGLLCRTVEKYPEAQKQYLRALGLLEADRNALEADPRQRDAFQSKTREIARLLFMLGETYERQSIVDSAIEYYDKAIKLAPDERETFDAYNNAAWHYATRKDPNLRQAYIYANKAKDLMPEYLEVRDTLGWVLYLIKNLDGAKQELKTAAMGLKTDGTVQYHYACVLADTGDAALAIQTLDAVIDLDFPVKAEAQALLAKLRGVKKD